LLETFLSCIKRAPDECWDNLEYVEGFSDGQEQSDDMTALVMFAGDDGDGDRWTKEKVL